MLPPTQSLVCGHPSLLRSTRCTCRHRCRNAGALEHSLPFNTFEDAVRLNDRLAELETAASADPIVCSVRPLLPLSASGGCTRYSLSARLPLLKVVGAGYAGVELAATLAERLGGRGRVVLLGSSREVMEGAPAGQRAEALASLASLGVQVVTDARVQQLGKAAGGYPGSKGAGAIAATVPASALDRRLINHSKRGRAEHGILTRSLDRPMDCRWRSDGSEPHVCRRAF